MMKFTFVEIILAQTEIQNKINPEDLKELMTVCSQKYKAKKDRQEYYGGIGLQTTALVIARKQGNKLEKVKMKYSDQKLKAFIDNLTFDNIDFLDDIVNENDKILSDEL